MRLDDRTLNTPIDLDRVMVNPGLISFFAADGFEMLEAQRGNVDYDSCYHGKMVEGKPLTLNYTRMDHSSKVRHIDLGDYNL